MWQYASTGLFAGLREAALARGGGAYAREKIGRAAKEKWIGGRREIQLQV